MLIILLINPVNVTFSERIFGPNTDLSMLSLTSANRGEREVYLFEVLDEKRIMVAFIYLFVNIYLFIFVFLPFLGPLPLAHGSSQARGLIRAVAAGLRQSHRNAGSEPRLQTTPQLTATPNP